MLADILRSGAYKRDSIETQANVSVFLLYGMFTVLSPAIRIRLSWVS